MGALKVSIVLSAVALLLAPAAQANRPPDTLATPVPGDACAAFARQLAGDSGVAISNVMVDVTASTKPPWAYRATAKGGNLEFDFSACAPKPAWITMRYEWLKRSVPITLTLVSGPIRSIGAHLEGSKAMIVAVDRQGRETRTNFKEDQIELYVGNDRGKLTAGFGVPASDYCADIIENKTGPVVRWCGD